MIKKVALSLLVVLIASTVLCRADEAEVDTGGAEPVVQAEETVWSETDEYGSDFTVADKSSLKETKFQFQAEINRLMSILVNSLYSNRDVFLRELISNASDALDKIRFIFLTRKSAATGEEEDESLKPQIRIWVDKEKRQLNIRDTGIGMTKEELTNNLGKIAKSGTSDFIQKLSLGGENLDSQIGQFGVGFYSSFLVAHTVTVTTKSEAEPQYVWQSSEDDPGSYTIAEDPRKDTLKRGTLITLDLKADADVYMRESKLRSLVMQYSEFINFPIYLRVSKAAPAEPADASSEEESDAPAEEPEAATEEKPESSDSAEKESKEADDDDDNEEESKFEMDDTTGDKIMYSWEQVNNQKPLWTRKPSDISKEDYEQFYKVLNKNDTNAPIDYVHFTAEGDHTFTCLLYIPSRSPFDAFDRSKKYQNLRLYVKRVYITDSFDDILPRYLAFLVGLVDSDNLPLNVSREVLQRHRLMHVIRRKIVSKVISLIENLFQSDREQYEKFYREYSSNLKYGVTEDKKNSYRLIKLLLFNTHKHPKDQITLTQYVEEMPEGQTSIYYIGGESMKTIKGSPLIEPATKKGYDVLYLPSTIDAYTIEVANTFRSSNGTIHKFIDLTKDDDTMTPEEEKRLKELEKGEYKPLLDFFTDTMKGHHIGSVKLTGRLHNTPCTLIASKNSYSANMERILKAQYAGAITPIVMKALGKTFEFNADHPIVRELLKLLQEGQNETVAESIRMLYESAVITSGYSIEQPVKFGRMLHRLIGQNLRIPVTWSADEPDEAEAEEEAMQERHRRADAYRERKESGEHMMDEDEEKEMLSKIKDSFNSMNDDEQQPKSEDSVPSPTESSFHDETGEMDHDEL